MCFYVIGAVDSYADTSGTCGENVTWEYNTQTFTLVIRGNGAMYDYASYRDTPWDADCGRCQEIIIEDGITAIGNVSFVNLTSTKWVTVPESVTKIGDNAFPINSQYGCRVCFKGAELPAQIGSGWWNRVEEYYLSARINSCTLEDENGKATVRYAVINESTVMIGEVHRSSSEKEIKIPTLIEGLPVTEIGGHSFLYQGYEVVQLPETVEIISPYAFASMSYLKDIVLPDQVKIIGNRAFQNDSSLTEIELPKKLVSIGDNAFSACSSLEIVSIPESVTTIGTGAFSLCNALLIIVQAETLPENLGDYWSGSAEILFGANTLYDDSFVYLIEDGNASIKRYIGAEKDAVIPEHIEGIPVIGISKNAFKSNKVLQTITLASSITEIGAYAFSESTIKEIVIPDTVDAVQDYAFSKCSSLVSCTIESAETKLGDYVLSETTALRTAILPDGMTAIPLGMFYKSHVDEVTIPNTVATIEKSAFQSSYLKKLELPESVKTIKQAAFEGNNSLRLIELPGSLERVEVGAFYNLANLRVAMISGDINYLGSNAVSSRKNATIIVDAAAEPDEWASGWNAQQAYILGKGIIQDGIVYCVSDTQTSVVYYTFPADVTEVAIPDEIEGKPVTAVMDSAFSGGGGIKSLVLTDNIIEIGAEAFKNCGMITIKVPGKLEVIGDSAFFGCQYLTACDLPDTVVRIGKNAFNGCESLEQMIIPERVTRLEEQVFYRCKSLQTIQLPDGIITIGDSAFYECKALEELVCPSELKSIGRNAFRSCYNILVYLNEGLEEIGAQAFYNCYSIGFIEMPDSVQVIGSNTFHYDTVVYLNAVTIPEGFADNWNGRAKYFTDTRIEVKDGLAYGIHSDKTVTVCWSEEDRSGLTIPSTYKKMPVVAIGYMAFAEEEHLQHVDMPNSIKTIGDYAFNKVGTLREVRWSNGLESIGEYAFNRCAISSVVFTKSLRSIGFRAFLYTNLEGAITIPEGTEYLGADCFAKTKVSSIVLPKSLKGEFTDHHAAEWLDKNVLETVYCRINSEAYDLFKDDPETRISFLNDDFKMDVIPVLNMRGKITSKIYYIDKTTKKKIYIPDYKLSYDSSKPGKHFVTITGTGKYVGSFKVAFKVRPAKTKIVSLKNGSKSLTVKWAKPSSANLKYTTGYQVQCATNSKFTTGKKTIKIKGKSIVSKKVTKLKAKKKYYVRVRTYYVSNGVTCYSNWSTVKTVTTKKS